MVENFIPSLSIFLAWISPAVTADVPPDAAYRQPGPHAVATAVFEWHDSSRHRDVPVKIYYPKVGDGPFPVIIFSHGLGGSRDGYEYLGRHWASHGYVSVHPTHIGSDSAILKREGRLMDIMSEAASDPSNAIARPRDIAFVIDQLVEANANMRRLQGRLALDRIGVAGHSFGAYTALASAGQSLVGPNGREGPLADTRIRAAIAMSTPARRRDSAVLDRMYGSIAVPCFHMTGTRDSSPIGDTKAEDRRLPFDHMTAADNYLLTLNGGNHMVFSGIPAKLGGGERDDRFHELILMSSTAFWDAYLKADAKAKAWLAGGAFAKSLDGDGTFEVKQAPSQPHPSQKAN